MGKGRGNAITSGPFAIPLFVDGSSNFAVDRLLIGLNNSNNRTKTVFVTVERLSDVFFPNTSANTIIPGFNRLQATIPPNNFTVLSILAGADTFQGSDWLRVTIQGQIDDDSDGIEVGLFGGFDGRPTVTMIFKHEDFIEIDDD